MENKQKYYENVASTIIKSLKKRQMEGYYCKDKESALKKALELIPNGSSIGYGGSMTLSEIGLIDVIIKFFWVDVDIDPYKKRHKKSAAIYL